MLSKIREEEGDEISFEGMKDLPDNLKIDLGNKWCIKMKEFHNKYSNIKKENEGAIESTIGDAISELSDEFEYFKYGNPQTTTKDLAELIDEYINSIDFELDMTEDESPEIINLAKELNAFLDDILLELVSLTSE